MSKEVNIKGDQKMEVFVNDYSFSQFGGGLAGGISADAQPTPESSLPDGLVNPLSLKNCKESMGKSSDNINEYSASKTGRSLA